MRNKIAYKSPNVFDLETFKKRHLSNFIFPRIEDDRKKTPEILFITTYPPRECGIATYSQDLIESLKNKFENTFKIKICALESNTEQHVYTDTIQYILNINSPSDFIDLARNINMNTHIEIVLIQHKFGLFQKNVQHFKKVIK